jgi:hypothetical protein
MVQFVERNAEANEQQPLWYANKQQKQQQQTPATGSKQQKQI